MFGIATAGGRGVAPLEAGWRRVAALCGSMGAPALAERLEAERARWFVWVPVLFGLGIVAYFHLPWEPGLGLAVAAPAAALALRLVWRRGLAATVLTGAMLSVSMGFAVAKVRTEWTRAPVLERKLDAVEVRGHVELVEPRGRGQRITIRVVAIAGLAPDRLPERVRIRAMRAHPGLAPGDAIRIRATLSPPAPPPLPGGYDFARSAWFSRLGGSGFALRPPEIDVSAPPAPLTLRWSAAIERLRQRIGERIVAAVPGESGAIANSLITGERGGISARTNDMFRDSGLIHILSISGLHMVVMAGAVFAALRLAAAAVPAIALRYPTKKYAAVGAWCAAAAYLMISGAQVATVRAFIMTSVMFLAVILERPAIAMRNVALAALVILAATPESVLDAGFQMSFAAVVSLIAAYEMARGPELGERRRGLSRHAALFLGGIVASTLIASTAVAPFAAYHFHRSQQYAILANLLAIPICNFVVMPAALATLLAMPLGLEVWPLTVMAWGIDGMTWAATWVAGLPGAVAHIAAMPEAAFALMIAGGLWLTIWREGWRWLGLAAAAAGVALAPVRDRPDILVGAGGALVAVRGEEGRLAVLTGNARSYALRRWLEHDGDSRTGSEAAKGGTFRCDGAGCTARVKGEEVAVVRHAAAFRDDCRRARVIVADVPAPRWCTGPAAIVDTPAVRRAGAHALYFEEGGAIRMETVAGARGDRPWSARRDEGLRQKPAATGRERLARGQ